MKIKVNVSYNKHEFTHDEMKKELEPKFLMIKHDERIPGTVLLFKDVLFTVGHPIIDLENFTKVYNIQQTTSNSKIVKPS